jgi:hypothetical protein
MATVDVGITQRPPSSALLSIDSEDRFASYIEKRASTLNSNSVNASPYDFSLIKNASLLSGYMTRLAVTEVVFPWVLPNVNDSTSVMTFSYQLGSALPVENVVFQIPNGFYTPIRLGLAVTTAINALVPTLGLAIVYGVDNLPRFGYNVTFGNLISFAPMVYGETYVSPGGDITWLDEATVKQLFDLMGFSDLNTTLGNFTYSQSTLCQSTRYIDIVSPQLTANQGLIDATSQQVSHTALCRLYLGDADNINNVPVSDATYSPAGCSPFVLYRQFSTPKQIAWNTIQPINGRIKFQVYDDNGLLLNPRNLGTIEGGTYLNYSDWSMSLLLTEN